MKKLCFLIVLFILLNVTSVFADDLYTKTPNGNYFHCYKTSADFHLAGYVCESKNKICYFSAGISIYGTPVLAYCENR